MDEAGQSVLKQFACIYVQMEADNETAAIGDALLKERTKRKKQADLDALKLQVLEKFGVAIDLNGRSRKELRSLLELDEWPEQKEDGANLQLEKEPIAEDGLHAAEEISGNNDEGDGDEEEEDEDEDDDKDQTRLHEEAIEILYEEAKEKTSRTDDAAADDDDDDEEEDEVESTVFAAFFEGVGGVKSRHRR